MQAYDWPGNVRELMNLIERAVITSRSRKLRFELLGLQKTAPTTALAPEPSRVIPQTEIKRLEKENILAALNQSDWRVHGPDGAAELLDMRPTTLASRIKRMGLTRVVDPFTARMTPQDKPTR